MASKKKQFCNIIIIGDQYVGKTSLMNQYVNARFTEQYRATVGTYVVEKEVMIDDRMVILQIWDTAGQERFQFMADAFYRGADCCVLVYDITNPKSFDSLDFWRDEFLMKGQSKDPDHFPFATEMKVQESKAQQWCESHGNIKFFEVSAKDATNIEQAFQDIAKAAASQEKNKKIFFPTTVTLTKQSQKPQAKQRGCC